jgi:DNA-binding CsgD family transcriptional regulator
MMQRYPLTDTQWRSIRAYIDQLAWRYAALSEDWRDPSYFVDRCLDSLPDALRSWRADGGMSLASWIRLKLRYALAEPRETLWVSLDKATEPTCNHEAFSGLWWGEVLLLMTPAQRRLAVLLAQGYTTIEAARMLNIGTMSAYVMLSKLRQRLRHLRRDDACSLPP